ncbi:MAG: zf-HC2 domain-containing protein [Sphingomonas sp.]|nr:zf-HC2 domain-containing protein [Sphingomonas sp.]
MARILPFTTDPHRETRDLMPWLITGRLEPEEQARVEAHLAACEACSRELAGERALAGEVAELPIATGIGWAAMRDRLDTAARQAAFVPLSPPAQRRWTVRKIGTMLAAQAALLAAAVTITLRVEAPTAPYHALGSAPAVMGGNAIVIFRPDARESDISRLLKANDARLVDGPTAANAYVLHLPVAGRTQALDRLRGDAAVVLAEPLDAAALR